MKDDYFIIRNSWGKKWGEDGYIRMQKGQGAGNCGVANFIDVVPTFN